LLNNSIDLTLTDNAVAQLNGGAVSVTRANGTTAVIVIASAVNSSSATITVDGSSQTAAGAMNYTIGLAKDVYTGTKNVDTVTVTDDLMLAATDSFSGGAGADILQVNVNGGATAAASVSLTTAQMIGVESFSVIQIDDASTNNFFGITIDDAFVQRNALSSALSISARDTGGTVSDASVTIDASAVTSTAVITLNGGTKADTLKGGAGADEFLGLAGIDTMTGGGGKDDFKINTVNTMNIITDFNFGTSSTTVDQLDLSGNSTVSYTGGFDIVSLAASDTHTSDTDVVVLDAATYATSAAAEDAAHAYTNGTGAGTDLIVIWQDSFGVVTVSVDTDDNIDAGGLLPVAQLTGLSIQDIKANIDVADFIII